MSWDLCTPPALTEAICLQVGWRLVTTATGQDAIRHEYKVRSQALAVLDTP